jgi:hypothetical protein
MILYSTTWLFFVQIWWCKYCEYEKRKKYSGLLKKTVFCPQKPWKNPFFFDFLDFQGADVSAPNFKKLVCNLFAIMKGNFSALAVNRIREKSKTIYLNVRASSKGFSTRSVLCIGPMAIWACALPPNPAKDRWSNPWMVGFK